MKRRSITVVIPTLETEEKLGALLDSLQKIKEQIAHLTLRICVVTPQPSCEIIQQLEKPDLDVTLIYSRSPRYNQLNNAIMGYASEKVLVLHADSGVNAANFEELLAWGFPENKMAYFKLAFFKDGPKLMPMNSVFANARSRILNRPFGDQGFAFLKRNFKAIGGFKAVTKGEDQEFIQRWLKSGYRIVGLRSKIYTSARLYKKRGWLRVTLKHLYLTLKFESGLFPKDTVK